MIDEDFCVNGTFLWQNAGSSWRNFERIKYLWAFLEAIKIVLMKLEKILREIEKSWFKKKFIGNYTKRNKKTWKKNILRRTRRIDRSSFTDGDEYPWGDQISTTLLSCRFGYHIIGSCDDCEPVTI